MSNFAGMEDLLSDFLIEAGEMLSEVEDRLVELERSPEDNILHNEIFRGFHTIKGGAGFLNAGELVALCHIIENLFDKLRNRELVLSAELMGVIFAATAEVRRMFATLQQSLQPSAAPAEIIAALKAALSGQKIPQFAVALSSRKVKTGIAPMHSAPDSVSSHSAGLRAEELLAGHPKDDQQAAGYFPARSAGQNIGHTSGVTGADTLDWNNLYSALTGTGGIVQTDVRRVPKSTLANVTGADSAGAAFFGRRETDVAGSTVGRRESDMLAAAMDDTLRVDSDRLNQVLNLSGEIALTRNRLSYLRSGIIRGRSDVDTMREFDQMVSQLDMQVVKLQSAVKKARMQPIGRLLKIFPRLARDVAQSSGKAVELLLLGGETEIDTTLIENLGEPLAHLVSNTLGLWVESIDERTSTGKQLRSIMQLRAWQEGDHLLIALTVEGGGMCSEIFRNKAIEQGLITSEKANTLSETQCMELIFLPGFAANEGNAGMPGRGAGMDVVKADFQKLNGDVSIRSEPGKGAVITIRLPLTLATLPVLIVRLAEQLFAVPLSIAREILPIAPGQLQQVSGKATMVVHGEVLPVLPLAQMIGWEQSGIPGVGVLMQMDNDNFIMAADAFAGHDDVVVKPFETFRPNGVAGVTMSSEGDIALILDIKELLGDAHVH